MYDSGKPEYGFPHADVKGASHNILISENGADEYAALRYIPGGGIYGENADRKPIHRFFSPIMKHDAQLELSAKY